MSFVKRFTSEEKIVVWLFTKYGSYSAVCARQGDGSHGQPVDPNRIMVRARLRRHIEALKDRFPNLVGGCYVQRYLAHGPQLFGRKGGRMFQVVCPARNVTF